MRAELAKTVRELGFPIHGRRHARTRETDSGPLTSELLEFQVQDSRSVLFVTLDSCRYDTFDAAHVPHLKKVGTLHRAMAPATFTYGSHAAMFVGFTPGVAACREPYVNPKFGKIFKLVGHGGPMKGTEHFALDGQNIIDAFKRIDYLTVGSGAVRWFDSNTETGRALSDDFDCFFYSGNTYSLRHQIAWLHSQLCALHQPVFAFLNVGETHVPYYFEGADWSPADNPCRPFNARGENDADVCQVRQRKCLEFVDRQLGPLLAAFSDSTILVCGDHGDAWGEDGLWEHGIFHPKVLEVPLLFRLGRI